MIRYNDHTLEKYLDILASREPVPGGGSAAAVCGALGAALIAMSARYSIGKGKDVKIERRLEVITAEADIAREKLLSLSGEDAQAYLDSVHAKKEGEAAHRKALKRAAAVPQEIKTVCEELLLTIPFLMQEGNKYLISDVRGAEAFLNAAIAGADIMIETNS